jgi:hypothetical protein
VEFGESIRLISADVNPMPSQRWKIDLLWESQTPVSEDYTIFVHAYDETGSLLGTDDGPPLQGGFPTHLWKPGDRIATSHMISPDKSDPSILAVGLYGAGTGQRLPAESENTLVENNAAFIWRAP